MKIDNAKIYDNLPFIGLLITIVLMMAPIPIDIKNVLVWVGMGISIGSIFALDYTFTLAASKYLAIEATLRPSNKVLYLFIKEPQQGLHSYPINPQEPKRQSTTLPLAFAEKIEPHYMNITKITIEHDLQWEERMIFQPGKTIYKGYQISHNKIARISLWEPERNPSTQYHLEDNPRFSLSEGSRDWYLAEEPVSPLDTQTQTEVTGENQKHPIENCNKCALKKDAETYKKWYNDQQRYTIRLEGLVETLQNQFKGALSRTRDVTKLTLEILLTLLAAHNSIAEAVREVKPKFWTLTKELAIVIVAIAALVLYSSSADFRTSLAQNWLGIAVLLGIGGFIIYMLYYNKGKK